MRPTRTALRLGTLILFAALWLVAARLLWRTDVPDRLELPQLDAASLFDRAALRRAARHDSFLRLDLLLALLAQLAAIAVVARRASWLERRLPGGALVRGTLLGALAFGAGWLARLPFGLAAHWWERRYGLAVRGYPSWLWHRLPGPGELALLVACVLLAMLLGRAFGRRWWLAAAPLAVALAAVLVVLQPLFGPTLRPLPDRLTGDLRPLARGIDIGVERASSRTRRATAEAIGVGPTRRIVLWDTLLDGRFQRGELRVLTAHEAAHHRRRHALKGLAWFAVFALPCAFVAARVTDRRGGPGNPAAIPLLLVAVAALQLASLPVAGAITRRYEAEADWRALEATRDPAAARSLFKRFSRVNVDDPDPPGWAFVLFADHPPLIERIAMAEAFAAGVGSAGARTRTSSESARRGKSPDFPRFSRAGAPPEGS